jgi:hypothetical protein
VQKVVLHTTVDKWQKTEGIKKQCVANSPLHQK